MYWVRLVEVDGSRRSAWPFTFTGGERRVWVAGLSDYKYGPRPTMKVIQQLKKRMQVLEDLAALDDQSDTLVSKEVRCANQMCPRRSVSSERQKFQQDKSILKA
jgi:hypothetical protein